MGPWLNRKIYFLPLLFTVIAGTIPCHGSDSQSARPLNLGSLNPCSESFTGRKPAPPNTVESTNRAPIEITDLNFKILQSPIFLQNLRRLGDRIVLRLAQSAQDLKWNLLSTDAFNKINASLRENKVAKSTLQSLATQFGVSIDQAQILVEIDGTRWIREMNRAREKEDWEQAISIFENELNGPWQSIGEAVTQVALALNRRNRTGDRSRAISLIQRLLNESSNPWLRSEAYGILGRIYKDQYNETKDEAFLDQSISTYIEGFRNNPIDYYPGTAAIDIMLAKKTRVFFERAVNLAQQVSQSLDINRKRFEEKGEKPDYWFLASSVQILALRGQWDAVKQTLPTLFPNSGGPGPLRSTQEYFQRLLELHIQMGTTGPTILALEDTIEEFQRHISQPQRPLHLSERSVSHSSFRDFPDMEGAFHTGPFYLHKEIEDSEVLPDLRQLAKKSRVHVISFPSFLQKTDSPQGILLAPTGPYFEIIGSIASATSLTPWWRAYGQFGIPLDPANSQSFIQAMIDSARPVYILIPKNFRTAHKGSHTLQEFELIVDRYTEMADQIHFVFGFEETVPIDYRQRINEFSSSDQQLTNTINGPANNQSASLPHQLNPAVSIAQIANASSIGALFIERYKEWLESLGEDVKDYVFGSEFEKSSYPFVYDEVLAQLPFHIEMRGLHTRYLTETTAPHGTNAVFADLGSGTGLLAGDLQKLLPNATIHQFEPSSEMSAVARKKGDTDPSLIHNSSIPNLHMSENRPLESSSFDGLSSSNVLYLLTRDEIHETFKEVARLLKTGGRFTVSSMADVPEKTHISFLEEMNKAVTRLESQGKVAPGSAEIFLDTNKNLVQATPTLLNIGAISEMAAALGLKTIATHPYYKGAGIFMAFEKLGPTE